MQSKRLFSIVNQRLKKRYVAEYVSSKQDPYLPYANVQAVWHTSMKNASWIGSAPKWRKMTHRWFHSAKYAGHRIQPDYVLVAVS